jgi:hypothetical protein
MAGTRSAPTVDGGTANRTSLSMKFMDAGGDKRSVSIDVPNAITGAQIDALANAAQAISNATLYEITKNERFTSVPVEANAQTDSPFTSVFDNLVVLCKDVSINKSQDGFVPSVEGIIVPDGDVIDTDDVNYIAYRDALVAALGGNYAAVSARFTERRDKNDSVPA